MTTSISTEEGGAQIYSNDSGRKALVQAEKLDVENGLPGEGSKPWKLGARPGKKGKVARRAVWVVGGIRRRKERPKAAVFCRLFHLVKARAVW